MTKNEIIFLIKQNHKNNCKENIWVSHKLKKKTKITANEKFKIYIKYIEVVVLFLFKEKKNA